LKTQFHQFIATENVIVTKYLQITQEPHFNQICSSLGPVSSLTTRDVFQVFAELIKWYRHRSKEEVSKEELP